jgi:hypothetical protein
MRYRRSGHFGTVVLSARIVLLSCLTATSLLGSTADAAVIHHSSQITNAKRSLLVLSDLPRGWTSAKSQNGDSAFPGAAQLATCIGVPKNVITNSPPSADSPDFSSGDQQLTVSDSVSIYPNAKAAADDQASLANPKTPTCLYRVLNGAAKSAIEAGFGAGASVGTITVTRTPASAFAPHSANFTAFIPVASQGTAFGLVLTVINYVKGNEEQTLTLTSVQSLFPTALARRLTTVAVGRL